MAGVVGFFYCKLVLARGAPRNREKPNRIAVFLFSQQVLDYFAEPNVFLATNVMQSLCPSNVVSTDIAVSTALDDGNASRLSFCEFAVDFSLGFSPAFLFAAISFATFAVEWSAYLIWTSIISCHYGLKYQLK